MGNIFENVYFGKPYRTRGDEFFEDDGSTDTFCGYGEDNSVILKAIDSALAYLSNKK